MVNEKNMTLWADALESGEFIQGKDALHPTPNTYCCLGVACEVAIRNGVAVEVDTGTATYDGVYDVLPDSVREWLGLDYANPDVSLYDGNIYPVSNLNDFGRYDEDTGAHEPVTFADIAALIRAGRVG